MFAKDNNGVLRIAELFLARVRERPDAVALAGDGTSMTYRALGERATTLAGGLVELGVAPETPVGLAFERSADAIVAMLAISLAGGAYVPLNPAFPTQRLDDLVADSGVRLVLADAAGRARAGRRGRAVGGHRRAGAGAG